MSTAAIRAASRLATAVCAQAISTDDLPAALFAFSFAFIFPVSEDDEDEDDDEEDVEDVADDDTEDEELVSEDDELDTAVSSANAGTASAIERAAVIPAARIFCIKNMWKKDRYETRRIFLYFLTRRY